MATSASSQVAFMAPRAGLGQIASSDAAALRPWAKHVRKTLSKEKKAKLQKSAEKAGMVKRYEDSKGRWRVFRPKTHPDLIRWLAAGAVDQG